MSLLDIIRDHLRGRYPNIFDSIQFRELSPNYVRVHTIFGDYEFSRQDHTFTCHGYGGNLEFALEYGTRSTKMCELNASYYSFYPICYPHYILTRYPAIYRHFEIKNVDPEQHHIHAGDCTINLNFDLRDTGLELLEGFLLRLEASRSALCAAVEANLPQPIAEEMIPHM